MAEPGHEQQAQIRQNSLTKLADKKVTEVRTKTTVSKLVAEHSNETNKRQQPRDKNDPHMKPNKYHEFTTNYDMQDKSDSTAGGGTTWRP